MRRATLEDVEQINGWVERDSGVKPDFTEFVSNPLNAGLIEGEGGALFVWRGPGIYEVHVFFEQRGKEVILLSRQMLSWMRENMGAWLFWAAVPNESRHVIMFTRLMGWKPWGFVDLPQGRCQLFTGE